MQSVQRLRGFKMLFQPLQVPAYKERMKKEKEKQKNVSLKWRRKGQRKHNQQQKKEHKKTGSRKTILSRIAIEIPRISVRQ